VRVSSVVLTLFVTAAPALAQTPDADLAAGIRQVDEGDYAQAVITLDRATRALASDPARSRELARGYLYLGVAYVGLGSETTAKARFRDALGQAKDLKLSPEQYPPKVIELFERAREESRSEPPAPAPSPSASASPAPAKGGGHGKAILIGLGGAAAVGVAVAAGGGGGSSTPASAAPTPAPVKTETIMGSISGGCESDTVTHRFVPTAAGTLDATLVWSNRDVVLKMYLGDTDRSAGLILANSTPASNVSARLTAPVMNRAYWMFVEQTGGGPCVTYTLALTYPQ
jgi:tetratricopeptide (TPR) repeat protein